MDLTSAAKLVILLLILAGGSVVRIVMDKKMKAAAEEFKLIEPRIRRWATGIMVAIVFVDCVVTFPKWSTWTWVMIGTFAVYGVYSLASWIARRTRTAPPSQ